MLDHVGLHLLKLLIFTHWRQTVNTRTVNVYRIMALWTLCYMYMFRGRTLNVSIMVAMVTRRQIGPGNDVYPTDVTSQSLPTCSTCINMAPNDQSENKVIFVCFVSCLVNKTHLVFYSNYTINYSFYSFYFKLLILLTNVFIVNANMLLIL